MTTDTQNGTYVIHDDLAAASLYSTTATLGYNDWIVNTSTIDNSVVKISTSGIKMEEGCDIKVGDRSLLKTLDAIYERLAILETNSKLEAEFNELRDLGDQYRKLEADLKEKMVTWSVLASRTD